MVQPSGKYRLDTRLGGGGMAEVFIGSTQGAEGFSRKVAIKRVLPGFSDNPAFSQMFIDEARLTSRLVHPNVVSVLDFDRDPDRRLFLVMELVEGKDLDALVASGLLPIPVVIFTISEALRGLGYAHDLPVGTDVRGVVHRDVSPHNVLLSWEGAVKVSDFGIAKARAASEATASVFIKGKPAYMSPEQANGQALDGRSDLFAIGIMLWEMLIGRRLFIGEDTRSTLAAVLFGQVPRPRSIRSDVPKDLERVVMKLLERDLTARYQTAEEAITELLECSDAARNGREALIAILAERFPNEAPVRQSVHRARSMPGGQSAPGASAAPHGHTLHAGSPAAALPSLGAVMSAPTVGVTRPKRHVSRILLVLLVTLASGGITFAIVSTLKGSGDPDPGSVVVAVPGSAHIASTTLSDAAARAASDAPIDALIPDAPIDAVIPDSPIDAGAPDVPPKRASSVQPARPVIGKKSGTLVVRADPILTVTLDSKSLGDTPIHVSVPAGTHSLHMTNPDAGHNERIPITIVEGQTLVIDRTK